MGLENKKDWKKFFKTTFVPKPNDTNNNATPTCTIKPDFLLKFGEKVLIIDANLIFHSKMFLPVVTTWNMLYKLYRSAMINYLKNGPTLEKLIICIDNPDKVPKNKSKTQKKRDGGCRVFTDKETEIVKRSLYEDGDINVEEFKMNINDMKESIMADRYLKNEIHGWIWYKIISEGLVREIRIIIDSVKFKSIKHIFEGINEKHPKDEFFVKLDIDLKPRQPLLISKDFDDKIGEGEIKAAYYLIKECIVARERYLEHYLDKDFRKETITVMSKDTDMIIILLLIMVDLIDKTTGNIPITVLLYDTYDVWNMTLLWRWIYDWYSLPENSKYRTRTPIETLAFLAILNGTDYTDGIDSVGCITLMKYYFSTGYKYLCAREHKDVAFHSGNNNNNNSNNNNNNNNELNDKCFYPIRIATRIGGYNIMSEITIDKPSVFRFICNINNTTKQLSKNLEQLEAPYLKSVWNLGYLKNGAKHVVDPAPLNPLLWGWKMVGNVYK